MKRFGIIALLVGSLSWSQPASSGSATGSQGGSQTVVDPHSSRVPNPASASSQKTPDKPLITIAGLCNNAADQVAVPGCKTVITESQFQEVIDGLQHDMRRHDRREFALHYADVLVLAAKAEEMGLDKTANFEEQMKLARIQILSQALTKAIREKAAQIPDKDIEDYFQKNLPRFQKADFDRIYVPRIQHAPPAAGEKLTDGDRQTIFEEADRAGKAEADSLRARALAGGDFDRLQAEAYKAAGVGSAVPATVVSVRRISLPPSQVSVMDLEPGEVSPVLNDPNGFYIYRLRTKSTLSLDEARNEIVEALRSQRIQDELRSILDTATPTLDESYFAQ